MLNTAIIGAGPYGLSIAAYFRHQGIPFRIFGRPMDSWQAHMPKGMFLKSDGFASNIYDPEEKFTLETFCAQKRVEYAHTGVPVHLDNFVAYGLAFREHMVPELEERMVVSVERLGDGFRLRLDDGETFTARRVVLAIGITHFAYTPEILGTLPSALVSHSFDHHDLEPFKGRSVVVLGGGSSAMDVAGLLRDNGADVQLVTRRQSLKFHSAPTGKPRSLWQQVRHPQSGLGPGLRSRFFSDAPMTFHYLPERLRVEAVRRTLGPSGGWFIKDKVIGRVPLSLSHTLAGADLQSGRVRLHLRSADGTPKDIVTEHVIAATGYRVNLDRLQFLDAGIRSKVKTLEGYPVLSSSFESSVPGLYFAGLAAANSFGPVMRFAFGAGFAARTVTQAVAKSLSRGPATVRVPSAVTSD